MTTTLQQRKRLSPLRLSGAALLCVLVLTAVFPFAWMLVSSTQPLANLLGSGLGDLRFGDVTFDAYSELFRRGFGRWILNSALVAFVVVIGNIVFDSLAAYPLARMQFAGRRFALIYVVAAIMIPAQVILLPLYLVMRDIGWLDSYWALILPYVVSPTGIFLLRQHYLTIPIELDEAAFVDGAGRLQAFLRVIVPNSWAAIGTVAALKFMWTWGEFAWPSLAINNSDLKTIPVGLAGFQGQFGTEWNLLMAGSVVAVVPVVVLFLFIQRWFIEGMTAGAVKG